MQPKLRIFVMLLVVLGMMLVVSACNMPADEDDGTADQTAVAQTVEAALPSDTPEPTATTAADGGDDDTSGEDDTGGGDDTGGDDDTGDDNTTTLPTNTPTATAEGDDDDDTASNDGEDQADFVADVTIPDYTEFDPEEEITKTWRVQNVGDTTWTTEYSLVFQSGERMGAPTSIPMPKEVKPNETVDISVDFTVPTAGGEYRSDWIFQNADGEEFGTGEGYEFPIYMIIVSAGEGGTASGDDDDDDGGIAGGAKVTGASVTVDEPNYSGSCPPNLTFTYKVTTSNAGKVNFNLVFTAVSPSGFSFDPPPQYSVDFTGGYTVTYTYTFLPSASVTATAKVRAVGSNTFTSDAITFKVNCQ